MLISCSHNGKLNKRVVVKPQTWYADKGPLGAVKFNTMSNVKTDIPKSVWDSMAPNNKDTRFGKVCADPEVFGENKKLLETLCAFYGYCTYPEVVQAVQTLEYMRAMGKTPRKQIKNVNLGPIYYSSERVEE